jgi:hypothetical protein
LLQQPEQEQTSDPLFFFLFKVWSHCVAQVSLELMILLPVFRCNCLVAIPIQLTFPSVSVSRCFQQVQEKALQDWLKQILLQQTPFGIYRKWR